MASAELTVIGLGRSDPSASEYYSVLNLDERIDKEQTLQDKVSSVERLLEE